jgi:hypothetical protein
MNNLANSYRILQRHEEAAAMMQKALTHGRTVLPRNDPEIGEANQSFGSDSVYSLHVRPQISGPCCYLL